MELKSAFLKIINDSHGMMFLLYVGFFFGYFSVYYCFKRSRSRWVECPICRFGEHSVLDTSGEYVELKCRNCDSEFLHFDRF